MFGSVLRPGNRRDLLLGPAVQNLEYDATTILDVRGRLVLKGSGNGIPALNLIPESCCKPIFPLIRMSGFMQGITKQPFGRLSPCLSFANIPHSGMQKHELNLQVQQRFFKIFSAELSARYLHSDASLMNGFSQTRSIHGNPNSTYL